MRSIQNHLWLSYRSPHLSSLHGAEVGSRWVSSGGTQKSEHVAQSRVLGARVATKPSDVGRSVGSRQTRITDSRPVHVEPMRAGRWSYRRQRRRLRRGVSGPFSIAVGPRSTVRSAVIGFRTSVGRWRKIRCANYLHGLPYIVGTWIGQWFGSQVRFSMNRRQQSAGNRCDAENAKAIVVRLTAGMRGSASGRILPGHRRQTPAG